MRQKMWGCRCAIVLAASIALVTPLGAEDPSTNDSPESLIAHQEYSPAIAEQRIEKALAMPLRAPLEFVDMPLTQVVEVLAEEYDIPIVFDKTAIDAVGPTGWSLSRKETVPCSPEVAVSMSIDGVSLRSALNLILRNACQGNLTYIIEDEVLLITSHEQAAMRLETRVYRVDDLFIPEDTNSIDQSDYDSLIDLIVSTVEHESWMENGTGEGEIQPYGNMLVIAQSQHMHDRIEKFLEHLRSVKQTIDADMPKAQLPARNRLITYSIIYRDKAVAESRESRNTIRNVIRQSVAWGQLPEGVEESETFLHVLPGRIVVRHVTRVVRQVQRVAEEVCGASRYRDHRMAVNGGMGGGANGAEEAGDSGAVPAK